MRSKSLTIASSASPACWRSALAAARISSHEIGLRFCGIVELEPRPASNGSAASPNSVADISITSSAILAEAAAEEGQELHGLGDAVAGDMPGDRRLAEAEFARQFGAACERLLAAAERGEGAGRATELGHQHTRRQFVEPLGMAVERRQPDRRLVAKGDRQRMLADGCARPSACRDSSGRGRRDGRAPPPDPPRSGQTRRGSAAPRRCP